MDLHGSTLTPKCSRLGIYIYSYIDVDERFTLTRNVNKLKNCIYMYMEGMFKIIYMPNIGHDLLGFFFQFCKGGGLIIIVRGMDQIWLEVKQESIRF
jgi:hypothetical protein